MLNNLFLLLYWAMRANKFGILLIFSLIPFVGLNSVQTVLADNGVTNPDCPNAGEVWDPNSNQCVPDAQCPTRRQGTPVAISQAGPRIVADRLRPIDLRHAATENGPSARLHREVSGQVRKEAHRFWQGSVL